MFDPKSRYANAERYQVEDATGRIVEIVASPDAPDQDLLGRHKRLAAERLDHLAYKYLKDPNGFWRICEANDAMLPDALVEATEIRIPRRRR